MTASELAAKAVIDSLQSLDRETQALIASTITAGVLRASVVNLRLAQTIGELLGASGVSIVATIENLTGSGSDLYEQTISREVEGQPEASAEIAAFFARLAKTTSAFIEAEGRSGAAANTR